MYSAYPSEYMKNVNDSPQFSAAPAAPSSHGSIHSNNNYSQNPQPSPQNHSQMSQPHYDMGPPSYSSSHSVDFAHHTSPPQTAHMAPIQQSISLQNPSFQIQQRSAPKGANNNKGQAVVSHVNGSGDFHRFQPQNPVPYSSPSLSYPQQQTQQNSNIVDASPHQQQGPTNTTMSPLNNNGSNSTTPQQPFEPPKNEEMWMSNESASDYAAQMRDYQQQQKQMGPQIMLHNQHLQQPPPQQHYQRQLSHPETPSGAVLMFSESKDNRNSPLSSGTVGLAERGMIAQNQPYQGGPQVRRQFVQPQPATPIQQPQHVDHMQERSLADPSPIKTFADERHMSQLHHQQQQRVYVQQISDDQRVNAATGKMNVRPYQVLDNGLGTSSQQLQQQRNIVVQHPQQLASHNQQFMNGSQQQQYANAYTQMGGPQRFCPSTMAVSQSQQQQQNVVPPPLSKDRSIPSGKPKAMYRDIKKKFKYLVYENEYYQEELRNLQRKLLKLSRDKNFLLDRLQSYEHVSDSSDDSDASVKTVEDQPQKTRSKQRRQKNASRTKMEKLRRVAVPNRPAATNTVARKRAPAAATNNGTVPYLNSGTTATKHQNNARVNSNASAASEQRSDTNNQLRQNSVATTSSFRSRTSTEYANVERQRNNNGGYVRSSYQSTMDSLARQSADRNSTKASLPSAGPHSGGRRLSNQHNVYQSQPPQPVQNRRRNTIIPSVANSTTTATTTFTSQAECSGISNVVKNEIVSSDSASALSSQHKIMKESLDEGTPAVIVSCAAPASSSSLTINDVGSMPKRKYLKRSLSNNEIQADNLLKESKNVKATDELVEPTTPSKQQGSASENAFGNSSHPFINDNNEAYDDKKASSENLNELGNV